MQECPYCTGKIRNNAKFCAYCGHDLRLPINPAFKSRYYEQVTPQSQSTRKNHIGLLGLLILIVGISLTCAFNPDSNMSLWLGLIELVGIMMVIYGLLAGRI